MSAPTAAGEARPDLRRPGRYHVIGVGGPGMSAIALILAEMGHAVSGSDLREVPVLERLRSAGVTVHIGHDPAYVAGCDAVTYSTAVPVTNVEVAAAASAGIPVLRRAGMLAAICACARSIAVAGTHGKTSTTSMMAMILTEAGLRPSFLIGGDVHDVGTGAQWNGSSLLVVEADESDGTFLELPLAATVVTNVEVDHLDHFGTSDAIVDAFDRYVEGISGPVVVCADDPGAAALAARHREAGGDVRTYGTDPGADVRITAFTPGAGAFEVEVATAAGPLGRLRVPLRGLHMARNAVGATTMALALGAPFEAARAALARFGGVARRFEFRGEAAGVTLVDDYAHLPAEIGAVLEAAATSGDGWRRVVAVFQPNRYSRMEVLSPEYRDAFVHADLVVIADVYPSGERPRPGVTGKLVVDAVCDAHPGARVVWVPSRSELARVVAGELRSGDVCISMGCGDVASLPDEVLPLLRGRA